MSSFFLTAASQKKRKRSDHRAERSSSKRPNLPNGSSQTKVNGSRKSTNSSFRRRDNHEADDELISGSNIDSDSQPEADENSADDLSSSENEDETAAERRLKLAERYLHNVRAELADGAGAEDPTGFDAADIDREIISKRLREDVAESKGRIYKNVAATLDFEGAWKHKMRFRADQDGLTAVAVSSPFVYTASRDKTLCKWEIPSTETRTLATNISPSRKPKLVAKFTCRWEHGKKQNIAHIGPILCLAVSPNKRFLATGGADRRIVVWDAIKLNPLKVFTGQHRDAVFAVSFRRNNAEKGPQTLYSASADRTIKVWNIEGESLRNSPNMSYVETLFGHEDEIVDIVGLAGEKCVSVGARDRSARLWKVIEENQLVFRGGGVAKKAKDEDDGIEIYAEGSIDRVTMIDEDNFVTGSDNGSLSLWSVLRKKPVFTVPLAHGADAPPTVEQSYGAGEAEYHERQGRPKARWITALASVAYSDLIMSASWDGTIRAWKVSEDRRRLESVGVIGNGLAKPSLVFDDAEHTGLAINGSGMPNGHGKADERRRPISGVVNDLKVFERGDRGKDGVSIVAVVSKATRLGRYFPQTLPKTRDEAVLIHVDKLLNA